MEQNKQYEELTAREAAIRITIISTALDGIEQYFEKNESVKKFNFDLPEGYLSNVLKPWEDEVGQLTDVIVSSGVRYYSAELDIDIEEFNNLVGNEIDSMIGAILSTQNKKQNEEEGNT